MVPPSPGRRGHRAEWRDLSRGLPVASALSILPLSSLMLHRVSCNCGFPRPISPGASPGASCTLLTMEPDRRRFTCLAPLGEELGAEGIAFFYL